MKNLFFITGRGRSGSWLLKSMLDFHPDLSVAPEALFLINLLSKYGNIKSWTTEIKNNFYEDLIKEKKIIDWWNLDLGLLKTTIQQVPEESIFTDVIMIPYALYARSQDKAKAKCIGDKNPEYSLHLLTLAKLFPQAKFVVLVRDPRDNIDSYEKVDFDANNRMALAYRWNYYNIQILKAKENLGHRLEIIKFEDLLTDTKNTLTRICEFLNVPYLENLSNFHTTPKNVLGWNDKITKPVDSDQANKWVKKTINYDDILSVCSNTMNHLGYDIVSTKKIINLSYGYWYGFFLTKLELLFFKLPYSLRQSVLQKYRKNRKVLK